MAVLCVISSGFFSWRCNSLLCEYDLFIHSSVDEYLVCFWFDMHILELEPVFT